MNEINNDKQNHEDSVGTAKESNISETSSPIDKLESETMESNENNVNNELMNSNNDKITEEEEKNPSFAKKVRDYILSFLAAIIIAMLFRSYVFARADVDGHSMESTLHDKDVIFVEKLSLLTNGIKRGQIIIFDSGNEAHETYVKRVIALEGDEIELKDGKVYLNGKELKEDYLKPGTITRPGSYLGENRKITIAKGEYFVLGDNREFSRDSREIGPITKKAIKGHTIIRVYPFNSMRLF